MIDLKARLQDALSRARDILQDGNTDKKAIIPDTALENDSDMSEEEFIDAGTEEHPSSYLTGASETEAVSDSKCATSPERVDSPQDDTKDILNTETDPVRKGKCFLEVFFDIISLYINLQTSSHGLQSLSTRRTWTIGTRHPFPSILQVSNTNIVFWALQQGKDCYLKRRSRDFANARWFSHHPLSQRSLVYVIHSQSLSIS